MILPVPYNFIISNVLMYNNIIYPSLETPGLGRQRIDKMSSNANGTELFYTPSFLPQKSPDFWNAATFFQPSECENSFYHSSLLVTSERRRGLRLLVVVGECQVFLYQKPLFCFSYLPWLPIKNFKKIALLSHTCLPITQECGPGGVEKTTHLPIKTVVTTVSPT